MRILKGTLIESDSGWLSNKHTANPGIDRPINGRHPMAMIRHPENFPAIVKQVRRQLALSQEELAHALGVSFATVNRWENGKTVPSKLAQATFKSFCTRMTEQGKLNHDQD